MQQVPDVEHIALGQWLVEPVVLVEGFDRGRIAGGLLAESRNGGVARDELGEHEGNEA